MWGFRSLQIVLQDISLGIRMMRKSPGFTVAAVLAMSLGIGSNSAIVSVVNGVLLRALPFKDPDRLVKVSETFPPNGIGSVSAPNFADWQRQNEVFEALAAHQSNSYNLHEQDNPE